MSKRKRSRDQPWVHTVDSHDVGEHYVTVPPTPEAHRLLQMYGQALGLPDGAVPSIVAHADIALGQEWPGVNFTLFGMVVPYRPGPYPWPAWVSVQPDGSAVLTQVRLMLVWLEGSLVRGEVRWHPQLGTRAVILRVEEARSEDDVTRVWRALMWLRKATKRGHPYGKVLDNLTPDAFRAKWAEVKRRVYEDEERQATQEDLASELGLADRKSIYIYCQDHGLGWPPC